MCISEDDTCHCSPRQPTVPSVLSASDGITLSSQDRRYGSEASLSGDRRVGFVA